MNCTTHSNQEEIYRNTKKLNINRNPYKEATVGETDFMSVNYTIQPRTVTIIFSLILPTTITAQTLSTEGYRGKLLLNYHTVKAYDSQLG